MDLYYTHRKDSNVILKASDLNPDFLVRTTTCGCCGGDSFQKLMPLYENPAVNYIRCEHCGAVTYDKIYSQQGIDKMYHDENYYEDYQKHGTSKVTFYGSDRMAKHILKHINLSTSDKKTISILDFGGGDGEIACLLGKLLLNQQKCQMIEVVVVDYNESLYPVDDKRIRVSRCFPLEDVKNAAFDIVIASAIIEHLPEPRSYLKMLFDATAKDGFIYFRTPYVFPIFKTLSKFGVNFHTNFPEHIWDLGEDWWNHADSSIGYPKGKVKLIRSCPSIVEKSLKIEFINALAAYVMKSVWYITHNWKYVGGWETIYQKQK